MVVTNESVTAVTLDGTVDTEWTLDPLLNEGEILARVVPVDGSVWIARGQHLEAFGAYGQALQQLDLEAPVLAMELDGTGSRLWLMTANGVELRHAIDGSLIRTLDLPDGAKPSQLAVDGVAGRAWLAVTVDGREELWRLDLDGEIQQRHALDGPLRRLAVDATGSVWALGESRLHRFLGETLIETTVDLEPPSQDRTYQYLQPRRDGTIWLSDGRWISRVDVEGTVLELHDFGPQADIQALALIETEEADLTPQLTIRFPHEGEIVDTTCPAIALAFEHTLAVDAASVQIESLGRQLAGQCSLTEEGAICLLDEALPEGEVSLQVSAADIEGHRSLPKERSFLVDPSFALNGDEPGTEPGRWRPRLDPAPDGPAGGSPAGGSKMTDPVYTPVASPRGIHPEKVYHAASDIDFVDTSSGNLTLRVPLGQAYSVGPRISYQFQLVYNSNIWDHVQIGCPPSGCPSPLKPLTFAMASANHNAGFGWEMHFGRLYAPAPPEEMEAFQKQRWPNRGADEPDLTTRWMCVAPDGGSHTLHALTGRDVGTESQPVRYSKDGSFPSTRPPTVSKATTTSCTTLPARCSRSARTQAACRDSKWSTTPKACKPASFPGYPAQKPITATSTAPATDGWSPSTPPPAKGCSNYTAKAMRYCANTASTAGARKRRPSSWCRAPAPGPRPCRRGKSARWGFASCRKPPAPAKPGSRCATTVSAESSS